jgi:hypothetical protein
MDTMKHGKKLKLANTKSWLKLTSCNLHSFQI